jgi:hypothetical protein
MASLQKKVDEHALEEKTRAKKERVALGQKEFQIGQLRALLNTAKLERDGMLELLRKEGYNLQATVLDETAIMKGPSSSAGIPSTSSPAPAQNDRM